MRICKGDLIRIPKELAEKQQHGELVNRENRPPILAYAIENCVYGWDYANCSLKATLGLRHVQYKEESMSLTICHPERFPILHGNGPCFVPNIYKNKTWVEKAHAIDLITYTHKHSSFVKCLTETLSKLNRPVTRPIDRVKALMLYSKNGIGLKLTKVSDDPYGMGQYTIHNKEKFKRWVDRNLDRILRDMDDLILESLYSVVEYQTDANYVGLGQRYPDPTASYKKTRHSNESVIGLPNVWRSELSVEHVTDGKGKLEEVVVTHSAAPSFPIAVAHAGRGLSPRLFVQDDFLQCDEDISKIKKEAIGALLKEMDNSFAMDAESLIPKSKDKYTIDGKKKKR